MGAQAGYPADGTCLLHLIVISIEHEGYLLQPMYANTECGMTYLGVVRSVLRANPTNCQVHS